MNEYVPDVVGIPLIWPDVLSVSPAGKLPELTDQLYGIFPPIAASVVEYKVLATPSGSDEVVICNSETLGETAILRFVVAYCAGELESLTATVNKAVPAAVGVPLIWPALLSVIPDGSEPELSDQV